MTTTTQPTNRDYFEACQRHYPDITVDQAGNLLMNATCYPFGTVEQVEQNLKDAVANTDGTIQAAIFYAADQLDEAWDEVKATEAQATS